MKCPLGGRILVKMMAGLSPGLYGSTVITEREAEHFLQVFLNVFSLSVLVNIVQAYVVK